MPLTHYPKNSDNLIFAWVQPPPPDVEAKEGAPHFLARPFSESNLWRRALVPGESVVGYHDAQPFTRFYGSIACDSSLEVTLAFSNDEVDADGHFVTDANLGSLNYDAMGSHQFYDPAKQEQTGKFFSLIFGRWIRVALKNTGENPLTFLRFYLRGSVF